MTKEITISQPIYTKDGGIINVEVKQRNKEQKIADGDIIWIDEGCVGYKCECGNRDIVVGEDNVVDEKYDMNICSKCGRIYQLVQTNIVYELDRKEIL